ncbi:tRNA (adenosine(37)-N6)-threonylcarbamoyltransferase complex ATPase subunit type 1 TsaE [Clostridium sp. 'White wine YQ']|uniref:tRNA (adenosine(37)-N6)-threonylcarbamoyltransferase complex ATPase subunit type 1 TsaE n=1 Tax=Clostridium sp. 'White wine YQ' TaxID=3027474 RepID=UPI002366AC9D|nr:tRNA (adenosine(37)-N6)-threonylcarbamoyltransferase complex ATPase subunit type 1 TsaE [Clostridium sp. 'White wine YQ']MDD7792730.1 tRNA (adenosine(37)-N6)-threonylcarbamoyltransferase complex ATPase subunit type 1 TsaE [Clostridium sp. 'White wine YQ']
MEYIIDSVEKTLSLGEKLGQLAQAGDVFCLTGDLGTGKTHISKGFAKGLGVSEEITSPTFNIVNEYHSGRIPLFHFDVYRVSDSDEIMAIGFDEYVFGKGATLIEWANYIEDILPEEFVHINIKKVPELGENFRKIRIKAFGQRFKNFEEKIL